MIKTKLIAILLLSSLFACKSNDTGSVTLLRKQNFDFNWRFSLGDIPQAERTTFDDQEWRLLDLPHDWSIEGEFSSDNPSGNDGGYVPTGIGWYRKTFDIPVDWDKKQVSIYFEGAYMNNTVYVNGEKVGFHPYGFTSFEFNITPYLKVGEKNLIAVRVDNSKQKNCRWYTGSGIYRHVWLLVKNNVSIPNWGVQVFTEKVENNKAMLKINAKINNAESSTKNMLLVTEILDKSRNIVTKKELKATVEANSTKEIIIHGELPSPQLWSRENPYLYELHTIILVNGKVTDEAYTPFGVRTIAYTAEGGFKLNGKEILLNGACIHSDNGALGAAAFDRAEERKIELMKDAGFNAVRTAHNPPSEALLNACDRLGMLVIDEIYDGWRKSKTPHDYSTLIDKYWRTDVSAMVLRDINHPSVIIWSTGNEIIERTSPEAVKTAKMLNDYVRELDPSRPVTAAHASWGQGWSVFDSLMAQFDIVGYNYYMHKAEEDHQRVPERMIIQTESYPREAFRNWAMVDKHRYIFGDFVWTGMDYLGESGIGRYYYDGETPGQHYDRDIYPWHGAYCGDVDQIGWRKPISHYRSMLYNANAGEQLYLSVKEPSLEGKRIHETYWSVWPTWESWTWNGHEGENIDVEIYSRYPAIRLYLNNKLMAERKTGYKEEYKAVIGIPYQAGELKVVGLVNGEEVDPKILKTADKASNMSLTADRISIKADGQDLSYITIELFDKNGTHQPNADNLLQFKLEGEGEIVGVDNANMQDLMPYKGTERKAWKGRALVIVKSTQKAGSIKLTVSSEGLPDAGIVITSK
ncbi:MAG: sugar-binding domain-containing protein [Mangrovibacterium sp.]